MPKLAGSATTWQNLTLPHTTAFVAELPAGPARNVKRYVNAVFAAARASRR
jgi:hypothetical protein